MVERYLPSRPFPPYAFLPGRDPHPTRDPRGHSYGSDETPPDYVPPELWRTSEEYLFGTGFSQCMAIFSRVVNVKAVMCMLDDSKS